MAELVDAPDSKSCIHSDVRVRVPPRPPLSLDYLGRERNVHWTFPPEAPIGVAADASHFSRFGQQGRVLPRLTLSLDYLVRERIYFYTTNEDVMASNGFEGFCIHSTATAAAVSVRHISLSTASFVELTWVSDATNIESSSFVTICNG